MQGNIHRTFSNCSQNILKSKGIWKRRPKYTNRATKSRFLW